jgi:hypothetical protein
MSATIMCALSTAAFTFKTTEANWLWTDHKSVAVILGIAALVFGSQWIRHQKIMGHPTKH